MHLSFLRSYNEYGFDFFLGVVVVVAMEISELITHVYFPGDHSLSLFAFVPLCSGRCEGIGAHSLFWLWTLGHWLWNLLLCMMAF